MEKLLVRIKHFDLPLCEHIMRLYASAAVAARVATAFGDAHVICVCEPIDRRFAVAAAVDASGDDKAFMRFVAPDQEQLTKAIGSVVAFYGH